MVEEQVQIPWNLVVHYEDFSFYSERAGKPREDFEQKSDMIRLLTNHSGCCMENSWGEEGRARVEVERLFEAIAAITQMRDNG